MPEANINDFRELLGKLNSYVNTQRQLTTSIEDSNKLFEQGFKQQERLLEKFFELCKDCYTLHQDQIESLTARVDELEGLVIDSFDREDSREKIKYLRHGIKGVD